MIAPHVEAKLPAALADWRARNSMSTINGLPPCRGVVAEIHIRIMPTRHGGRAYYHQAKYMPSKHVPWTQEFAW
jgi:hypothetical protein